MYDTRSGREQQEQGFYRKEIQEPWKIILQATSSPTRVQSHQVWAANTEPGVNNTAPQQLHTGQDGESCPESIQGAQLKAAENWARDETRDQTTT